MSDNFCLSLPPGAEDVGRILLNRYGCIAWVGALLVALLASLMIVAPLRTAAVQFLNNLGFEPDGYKVYPTPANPKDFYIRAECNLCAVDGRHKHEFLSALEARRSEMTRT